MVYSLNHIILIFIKQIKQKKTKINLSIVGSNTKKKNLIRNKLNALLEGVFLNKRFSF